MPGDQDCGYGEIDFKEVVSAHFATGKGVLQLMPGMTDEQILFSIKEACSWSNGMAFTVIPARTL
ncbi:hypothetical protein RYA05_04555 [Pseudomonas syringae pv. actinidiae]|nr:hypothetical protein [Pseudomonas syringae pv. actinidiae]